jgi:glutathione S-transferase
MKLVIGNKTYSSWSMRPWILLTHYEIPFEEILVKLDLPNTTAEIKKYSEAAKVPVLIDGDQTIWESLAIMEYLNEKYPNKKMYPADMNKRAHARCLANEMHAGFSKLRGHMTFHAKKRFTNFDHGPAVADIQRIKEIWEKSLQKFDGPFLMGEFSIVDAMYAPVVGRFQTYGVALEGRLKDYSERILQLPAVKAWYDGANKEDFIAPLHE